MAEETQTATFPWTWELTPEQWRSYLATHSAVVAMDDADRRARLDESEAIVARACAEAGRPTAPLRHEAFCVRWQPQFRASTSGPQG